MLKMKVFMYVLTFLGYAWSGNGAGFTMNVKDSVIAFGSILSETVQLFLHSWGNWSTGIEDEECAFICPNGTQPMRNKSYIPSSNGCGAYGFEVPKQYLPEPEMEHCCDEHDLCYDTCNQDKYQCDSQFKTCLFKVCSSHSNSAEEKHLKVRPGFFSITIQSNRNFIFSPVQLVCKQASVFIHSVTVTMGCKTYINSQKQACYCEISKGKAFPVEEYGNL